MNATQTIHCCWLHVWKTSILFIKPLIELGGSLWLSVILEAFNFSLSNPSQKMSRKNFKIYYRNTEFFHFIFLQCWLVIGRKRDSGLPDKRHTNSWNLYLCLQLAYSCFPLLTFARGYSSQKDFWRKVSMTYLAFEHSLFTSSIGLGFPKEHGW